MSAVDVLAVMDAAPRVTVAGVTVPHNTAAWRVATNRHSNTDGTNWGWIEGTPFQVCWSDNGRFNRAAAGEMVAAHAKWLEDQKPLSIKLVEARERYVKAKDEHDSVQKVYEAARLVLTNAEVELAALANVTGGGK